jgi:hypothetical protein
MRSGRDVLLPLSGSPDSGWGMADFVSETDALGNLVGICPHCSAMMYRRASVAQLPAILAKLDITIVEAR